MYLLGKAVNLPFQRSIAPKRGSLHQRTAFPSSPGWLMALDGALTQCLNRLMFIQLKTESYAAHLKRNILFTLEGGQIWRMEYTQRWTDRLSFWGLRLVLDKWTVYRSHRALITLDNDLDRVSDSDCTAIQCNNLKVHKYDCKRRRRRGNRRGIWWNKICDLIICRMVINSSNGYKAEHNNSSKGEGEKRMLVNVTLAGGSFDEEFDLF